MNKYNNKPHAYSEKKWVKSGLIWGASMFVIMTLVYPYLNNQAITLKSIVIGLILWSLGGIAFGYTMKQVTIKRN